MTFSLEDFVKEICRVTSGSIYIFCDTGKEFPQMYEHIEKVREYLRKNYNKDITILRPKKPFEYWLTERVKTRGKNKGEIGYGFPTSGARWCTDRLKVSIVEKYLNRVGEYKLYIGIAYDEPERIKQYNYPLFDWKITEKDALEYCYKRGFNWGGLYEIFNRVSCWLCPLQPLTALRKLWKHFPELWEELKELDSKSPGKFKSVYTVCELDKWFRYEEQNNITRRISRKILNTL